MKIIQIVSSKTWGGGEQYVYDLCNHLKEDDYRVEIVCRNSESVTVQMSEIAKVWSAPFSGFFDIKTAFVITKLIGEEKTILHVHNFKYAFSAVMAKLLSRKDNVRIIITRHLVRKGKTNWLYRWMYRHIDKVIFVSETAKKAFVETKPDIDENKLIVLHNSIVGATGSHISEDIRKEYGIEEDHIVAMYHGRLDKEKGVDVAVNAMKLLNDCKLLLVIVGTGNEQYTNQLKTIIKENNLEEKVKLVGFRKNAKAFVAQSDFGIVPSRAIEACPLAVLEYMAMGKPVVATNKGGQTEFINDRENGLLITPDNEKETAKAMREMAENNVKREEMGYKAKKLFEEKMCYNIFYNKIKQIYNES